MGRARHRRGRRTVRIVHGSRGDGRRDGGGTYDALVGLTAHSVGHELLSLDLRAERTYRSLGIAYRLLAQ